VLVLGNLSLKKMMLLIFSGHTVFNNAD